jgi:hypothetical protein
MRKEILNEIDRMRFLVGYAKGKVISEQNTIILEQNIEDGKPNFRALVSDLKNDFYPEWYYIPEKSNITSLTGDPKSFVAVRSNQLKRLTRGTIYLRANGDVFKEKNGAESVIGKWYYKSTPTGKHKFELKVDINKQTKTDDNSSNSSDVKTDPVTTTEITNEFIKTSPKSIEYFHGDNGDTLFIWYSIGKEVYSPIDGVIDNADNNFTSVKGATERVTIHDFEPSVKENDEVKKGQLLGKIKKPISNIHVYDKNNKLIDPRPLFNIK